MYSSKQPWFTGTGESFGGTLDETQLRFFAIYVLKVVPSRNRAFEVQSLYRDDPRRIQSPSEVDLRVQSLYRGDPRRIQSPTEVDQKVVPRRNRALSAEGFIVTERRSETELSSTYLAFEVQSLYRDDPRRIQSPTEVDLRVQSLYRG